MKRGFTLFELVATLALVGVVAVFGGMMLTSSIQRFLVIREAAATNQTVEIALARIVKELTWADADTVERSASGKTIRWRSRHPGRKGEELQELSWNGTPGSDLLLSGKPLIGHVESFFITEISGTGSVSIQLLIAKQPKPHEIRIHFQEAI